jgi:hypothetical protein
MQKLNFLNFKFLDALQNAAFLQHKWLFSPAVGHAKHITTHFLNCSKTHTPTKKSRILKKPLRWWVSVGGEEGECTCVLSKNWKIGLSEGKKKLHL